MKNFNERTNTLLCKNISLTLYSRKVDVLCCVWEMSWRQGQTTILTPSSSSTIATFLSHLVWVTQPWVTEGRKALSLQACSHAGILSPTNSNRPGHLVILLSYVHLLPLFFRLFTQVHLLIDGLVNGQYITRIALPFVDISLISLLSPELSGLFPQVILLFFLVFFPFCSHIFQDLFALPFWPVFVDFFYLRFQSNFTSWFWLFLRAFWGGSQFSHTLISPQHRLVHLTRLYYSLICKVVFDLFCSFMF